MRSISPFAVATHPTACAGDQVDEQSIHTGGIAGLPRARAWDPGASAGACRPQGFVFSYPSGPIPGYARLDGQWQEVSAQVAAVSNSGKWLADKAAEGILIASLVARQYGARRTADSILIRYCRSFSPISRYTCCTRNSAISCQGKVAVDFIVARVKANRWMSRPDDFPAVIGGRAPGDQAVDFGIKSRAPGGSM